MTVLSAVQEAATRMGISVPTVLFSDTGRTAIEIQEAVNEAASAIRDDLDWQKLREIHTVTGDGSYTSFDLPSDYARMLKVSRLWPSDQTNSPLVWVTDSDRWLSYEVQELETVVRRATIYGGQLHIAPTLESGVTVKYFYVRNTIVTPASGPNKATFTADTDSFFLDERLLKLSLIWRWKAAKGRPFERERQDYDEALDVAALHDRGSKVLHIGQRRVSGFDDVSVSYPRSVGL